MKKIGKLFVVGVAIAVVLIFVRKGNTMQALRLGDGRMTSLDQMLEEVKGSRLVYVGEDHNRKNNHEAQLEIIRRLHLAGVNIAIGMEMFPAESQRELDRWVAGTLPLEDFIEVYYREWTMPWPLYREILLYARDHRIPVIGLNVPREVSRKVAREGFSALTREERRQLPSGITCNIDNDYKEFIKKAYTDHAHNDKSFIYFCEAHMLWNKTMGWHLQKFLAQNPDYGVVVLAGTGHVMKMGIPEEVFQESPYSYKVILPEGPGLDRRTASNEDADYLVLFTP